MRTPITTSSIPAQSSFLNRISGQGMTEYIVIVALIAIAAIVAVSLFGASVKSQFTALASELVGVDGAAALADQIAETGNAASTAASRPDLGNYVDN